MALETATYVPELVASNPGHTDGLTQADSHLRLIKSALLATFPNFTAAALTSTQAALDAAVASVTGTGYTRFPLGTAALPGITPFGDPNTGIYSTGADKIAVSCGGVKIAEFSSAGVAAPGAMPIGGSMPWYSDTLPDSTWGTYAWKNGQAVSRTTYAALYAIIGTTCGVGDGVTTFNLPDVRENTLVGKGTMGGTSSPSRITNFVTTTLGSMWGECLHLLGLSEIPAHSHGITDPGHTHTVNGITTNKAPGGDVINTLLVAANTFNPTSQSSTTGITINNAGGGTSHNNVQPSLVCNWVMRIA